MPSNVVVLIAVLALATVVGLAWRRNNGHFRGAPSKAAAPGSAGPDAGLSANADADADRAVITAADIDAPLGATATLVQFSSAFCAPCRATRRVLGEVAAMVPGVEHVEIDAEHHLDLVRRLAVMRTPTTFVVDPEGRVITRASGQPRRADVIAALGRVAP